MFCLRQGSNQQPPDATWGLTRLPRWVSLLGFGQLRHPPPTSVSISLIPLPRLFSHRALLPTIILILRTIPSAACVAYWHPFSSSFFKLATIHVGCLNILDELYTTCGPGNGSEQPSDSEFTKYLKRILEL